MKKFFFPLAAVCFSLTAHNIDDALIGYWKFDETSGTEAADSSPMRNKPAQVFNSTFEKGFKGNALRIKGEQSFAKTAEAGSTHSVDGLTIDFYFKIDSINGVHNILGTGNPGLGMFVRSVNGALQCGIQTVSRWCEAQFHETLQENRWYRFTVVIQPKTARCYIDGKEFGKIELPGLKFTNNQRIVCGRSSWSKKTAFTGYIDEVKFYNRALTATELFNADPLDDLRKELNARLDNLEKIALLQELTDGKSQLKRIQNTRALMEDLKANQKKISQTVFALEKYCSTPDYQQPFGLSIYTVSATNAKPLLPTVNPAEAGLYAGKNLCLVAALNEYEPASFILYAEQDFEKLSFKVDLPGIPPENIDVKYLHAWYQDGGKWSRKDAPVAKGKLPAVDLLVNDPEFSNRRFDLATPLTSDDGKKVIPVKDAASLLPCKLAAGTNQQLIITLNTKNRIAPGLYRGSVVISEKNEEIGKIPFFVRIIPHTLPLPTTRYDLNKRLVYSVYYWGHLTDKKITGIDRHFLNRQRYTAEMRNLAAHNVTSPAFTWYHSTMYGNQKLVKEALEIARANGMCDQDIYFGMSGDTDSRTPSQLAALKKRVEKLIATVRSTGVTGNIYFYCRDEQSTQKEFEVQYKAMETMHNAGAKLWVSAFPAVFPFLKGRVDQVNCFGTSSAKETAKWHGEQTLAWNYGAPFGGEPDPSVYRRNYGFMLWHNNYDGICDYCYRDPFKKDANKQPNAYMRSWGFVYPTIDGVIDTISWEGQREAADDVRVITLFRQLADKNGELAQADAMLGKLDPRTVDTELLRLQLIKSMIK